MKVPKWRVSIWHQHFVQMNIEIIAESYRTSEEGGVGNDYPDDQIHREFGAYDKSC